MNSESRFVKSDISFIGSSISSSFTLVHFLNNIESKELRKPLSITIIDKYPEFNKGIPYGSRSGRSVLLITSLKNFLPEPELSKFLDWLQSNKEEVLEKFRKEGGCLSTQWLQNNELKIKNNQWEDLFIPRSFFGAYIDEKVSQSIKKAEKKGIAKFHQINDEAIDLEFQKGCYRIRCKKNKEIDSQKIVLSVGSLPVRYLWKNQNCVEKEDFIFINNPYNPNLPEVLAKIKNIVKKRKEKETNALIVGANASGLEMLYKLNDDHDLSSGINHFTMLSTLGLSPDSLIDKEKLKRYSPSNLYALQDHEELTAKMIADATFADLYKADEIELGAASTVDIISSAFGSLLNRLDTSELKKFACYYGNEIGRRQRCAGYHYSKTIESLTNENKFEHLAGRFDTIIDDKNGNHYLSYLDMKSKELKKYNTPYHIIVNCVGSTNFFEDNIPLILQNIIKKGYATPNESKIGFDVNESLESRENLHIMGPLLAGNIFEGKAVWHVEHCGRIIWLSQLLAKKLQEFDYN